MSRTLIIPDLHNKVRKAEFLLVKLKGQYDRVCFLGDYFDDFDDTPAHAERVARWLCKSLDRPERIHLLGNHDLAYLVPGRLTACSGFTIEKRHVIAEVLADVLLSRFAVAVNIEGWLVSHAGFHRRFAEGKTPEQLITMANRALKRLVHGVDEPLFGVGYARYGSQDVGGITWLDFDREFVATPGLHQIVGHTPGRTVRACTLPGDKHDLLHFSRGDDGLGRIARRARASVNWCLDTHVHSLALVDGESIRFLWV